eukprot:Lankesteria_metandrocarpae@DN1249_c0_g1_i1.p1
MTELCGAGSATDAQNAEQYGLVETRSQVIRKVRILYQRQLSLPLSGLSEVLDECRIFERSLRDASLASDPGATSTEACYERHFAKGNEAWHARVEFEKEIGYEVTDLDVPTLKQLSIAWDKYRSWEVQRLRMPLSDTTEHSKSGAMQLNMLYFRACDALGHARQDLWLSWADVLLVFGKAEACVAETDRALRQHSKTAQLWIVHLLCLIMLRADVESIKVGLRRLATVIPLSHKHLSSNELHAIVYRALDCAVSATAEVVRGLTNAELEIFEDSSRVVRQQATSCCAATAVVTSAAVVGTASDEEETKHRNAFCDGRRDSGDDHQHTPSRRYQHKNAHTDTTADTTA